jgi:hypothetical protein
MKFIDHLLGFDMMAVLRHIGWFIGLLIVGTVAAVLIFAWVIFWLWVVWVALR